MDAAKKTDDSEESFGYRLKVLVSLVLLVGIAVLKTQLTAILFSSGSFPTAYSLWSCIVTCLMLVICFLAGLLPFIPQTWGYPRLNNGKMLLNLFFIVLFTALDLAFTNIALSEISAAIQQCIASTNPFWTLLIETALYMRWQHYTIYLIVIVMVVGAALAAVSDFDSSDAWGITAACIG